MNLQYRFQLVFLRLVLKRNALSESTLRITLLETNKELESSSATFQTQQLKIKKSQKIVDLDSIKTFHFDAAREKGGEKFIIKYEIKGTSEQRVRTIPIHAQTMINQYENSKRSIFEASFGGENAEISYKFYLTKKQPDPPQGEIDGLANESKRSSSINRSKRPPDLNISKRTTPSQAQLTQQPPKVAFTNQTAGNLHALAQNNNMSPQPTKVPSFNMINLESADSNYSAIGIHKKISSLPLSEIEKVNELMATHYRPQDDHHGFHISYKLKMVIILLVIGILFLLFDTLSDRKYKKKIALSQDHHTNHAKQLHEHIQQGGHQQSTPKKSKRSQQPSNQNKHSSKTKKNTSKQDRKEGH